MRRIDWRGLSLLALATRLPAIWLLPNADYDAYSYTEAIGLMMSKLGHATFRVADLWGFWLPLYQFASALLGVALQIDPQLAGRILSACSGAASAVLVFYLTVETSKSRSLGWIAFVLVVADPYQIFLSSLSMTDVPHATLVLASALAAIRSRWIVAATCAGLASLVRVDSWVLLPLIPLLQCVQERRVSLSVVLCLLIAPSLWLGISYVTQGDPWAYFSQHAHYVENFLSFDPKHRGFGFLLRDLLYFLAGAHPLVLLVALAGVGLLASRIVLWTERRTIAPRIEIAPLILATYYTGLLGFLAFAYAIRAQPVIWVRYGTVFFLLGLPLAAWRWRVARFLGPIGSSLRSRIPRATALICLAIGVQHFACIIPAVREARTHQRIAERVRLCIQEDDSQRSSSRGAMNLSRCFCDDPAVRVLSGLTPERFLRTRENEVTGLIDLLRREKVSYLVCTRLERSLPWVNFPQLASPGAVPDPFSLLAWERSPAGYGPGVGLYRVRSADGK